MNKELQQKDMLFYKKYFKIMPDGLFFSYGNPTNMINLKISFENIGSHRLKAPFKNLGSVFVIFFGLVCVDSIALLISMENSKYTAVATVMATLFGLIDLGLIGLFIYYLRRGFKNYFNLTNLSGFNVEFIDDSPSAYEVEEFIKTLMDARSTYLKENYFVISKNLDYGQQLANLKFLFSESIITKAEYDQNVQELERLFEIQNPSKKTILGFGRSNLNENQ